MSTTIDPIAQPEDPGLPLLGELLDPARARPMLEAALAGRPVDSVRIEGVALTPGRLVVARYRVATGADEVLVTAMHGSATPPGGVRVADGAGVVAVWTYPDDPALPGLGAILDGSSRQALLHDLGVDGPATTRVRAYQPGRRAVVEIRTERHRLFAKVVRPKRVAELQRLHRGLAETLPIPRSLGWDPRLGIVVMEAVPGSSVAAALLGGATDRVAGPDDLIRLLDVLAECTVDTRHRPPPTERAASHATTLGLILSSAAERASAVASTVAEAPSEQSITAHRDFHTSQLLVHEGRLRLVDIDTVGSGTRADDLAMVLAQVTALARPGPHQASLGAYRDLSQRRFEEAIEPRSLRLRTAAAILGFALGPFRTQTPDWPAETMRRIGEAERFVGSAFKIGGP